MLEHNYQLNGIRSNINNSGKKHTKDESLNLS